MEGEEALMRAAAADAWAGEIPAVFVLATNEVTTLEPPVPFHLCLARQSYLPFTTAEVVDHFKPFAPPMGGGEPWYEHDGQPLRWHVPLGVLFDLHAGLEAEAELPWRLTVHFQGFPATTLLSTANAAAEGWVLNALKESCFLRCGSALPAMSLSIAEQKKLTHALTTNDFREYCAVAERISAAMAKSLGASGLPHSVPVRVFTSPVEWRQQPAAPRLPSGGSTRLYDVLVSLLPSVFESSSSVAPRVIVQGVSVPLETPLLWLHGACSHPDGFLYVYVSCSPPSTAPQIA
mmetsp:Transcript_19314/g.46350  ORF Transcript_19314/g.46350 Transcript_19314/m.46350 type:complete len:291 (+) Transcript_19314:42-914(+)